MGGFTGPPRRAVLMAAASMVKALHLHLHLHLHHRHVSSVNGSLGPSNLAQTCKLESSTPHTGWSAQARKGSGQML